MIFKDVLLSGMLLCVGIFTYGNVQANMLVYPMSADINGQNEEATSLSVYSKSEHIQYIRTRVMCIEHLCTPQEKEVPVEDNTEKGIIVSPDKFALAAGTKKQYALLVLRHQKKRKRGAYTLRLFLNWMTSKRQPIKETHP